MDITDLYGPDWTPPHCPSSNCMYHDHLQPGWRFKRMGHYLRLAHPRRIRRFRCLHCGVTFSSQTFATTYWLKKPHLLPQLLTKLVGGMCNSQIATDLGTSAATIDRQIYRLGRHCQLYHLQMIKSRPPLREVVLDSLVSFEQSQYHPYHLHLAVERSTTFIPWFTDSEVRRSGRMTAQQKARREVIEGQRGRPDPQAVRKDVRELLAMISAGSAEMTLLTDEHRQYRQAMRGLPCRFRHVVTSSRQFRGHWNDLFEINLLDLLIRHADAAHKRQTIAYSKRRNAGAWKLAIFLVWKNYLRPRRVRGDPATPAMLLGLCQRPLTVSEVLARRLFWARVGIQGRWRQYCWGQVVTRALRINPVAVCLLKLGPNP